MCGLGLLAIDIDKLCRIDLGVVGIAPLDVGVPRVAGAVGIPLPPAVGNGMVVELEYNKMVKMGGGRESPYPHGRMGYADTAPRFRCGRDWSEHERSE